MYSISRRGRRALLFVVTGLLLVVSASGASAHPHTANGQTIANGQNHGPYDPGTGIVCGGDPAAYGLETAHHGPDAGTPGKADGGCFQLDSWPPTSDDSNPAID
ncbi:MAG TPA: hypothetical protein VJ930_08370 [Acidimicrobiia bacterium]|nr:hypothetical protein [Acidimicrobiia bacterium]